MKIEGREIEWAEKLLLPRESHFDAERRAFIQCAESRDVVACPGSGKTTALLAKLIILGARMPFPDGRGICVLTHTNVAIDEIKKRAGVAAAPLFRYPNFFGTIQEFANRFLAIPACVDRFGQRHFEMDEDLYEHRIKKMFFDCDLARNSAIYVQLKNRLKGVAWRDQYAIKIDFLKNLQFKFDDDLVHYVRGDNGKMFLRGDGNSESYSAIHSAKYQLLREGCLRYQDAFPIALWYLQDNPVLSRAFGFRFAYLFVDEVQDTNAEQLAMLDAAFSNRRVTIVQRLGDPNQAIYHHVRKEAQWTPQPEPLHFSNSMRFGPSIAKILSTVRIDDQIFLAPNQSRPSLSPHLFLYNSGNEQDVLPAFSRLLKSCDLHLLDQGKQPVFKAIGWVGEDKEAKGKLCLASYLPEYRRAIRGRRRRRHFTNLLSYLCQQPASSVEVGGSQIYRDAILSGLVRGLGIAGYHHPETERAFTLATFLNWLREKRKGEYQALLSLVSEWCLRFERGDLSQARLRSEVAAYLQAEWCKMPSSDLRRFIEDDNLDFSEREQQMCNIYSDGDIEIEVGTVHSAKGETHTATLYLDTFYQRKVDSDRLLPFLKGGYPKRELGKAHHIENLKIAHVAMSRPTHLLAFACSKAVAGGHAEELEENGWEIFDVARWRDTTSRSKR